MHATHAVKTHDYAEAVRAMIAHEDDLLNNRMNWLLVVQGLLFTGLGSLEQAASPMPGLVYVLIVFGFLISISSKVAFMSGERAIRNLLDYWQEHLTSANRSWQDYPPVFGAAVHDRTLMRLDRFLSPQNLLPLVFASGWVVIFVLMLND